LGSGNDWEDGSWFFEELEDVVVADGEEEAEGGDENKAGFEEGARRHKHVYLFSEFFIG
jgi:hypothetical protein